MTSFGGSFSSPPARRRLAGCLMVALLAAACTGAPVAGQGSSTTSGPTLTTTSSGSVTTTRTRASSTTVSPTTTTLISAGEDAMIVTVVDGDTVEVGLGDGSVETVRLIGVDAPEWDECYADEATRELATLTPTGTGVSMTTDISERDRFGRLLRYLWVGDTLVNEALVAAGVALARRYPPDTAMAERLESAQAEAEDAGRGLWGEEACGTRSEATLTIAGIRYDTPGNDNENLNEEWIEIRNQGSTEAALDGWMIRDHSSMHRYSFPDGFLLAAGATVVVRTGCGVDTATELYWCNRGSAVWNNDGDTGFLLDSEGNIHATYSYSR